MAISACGILLDDLEPIIPGHIARALDQICAQKTILAAKLARMEESDCWMGSENEINSSIYSKQTRSQKAGGWIT